MKESEIKKLEKKFNLRLPENYKEVLLNFPVDIKSAEHNGSRITDLEFNNDFETLIEHNDLVREGDDWITKNGIDAAWPLSHFVIGEDGCGNYYAIDTTKKSCSVLFYDHEIGGFEKYSSSMSAFQKKLLKDFKEGNEEFDLAQESVPKKKETPKQKLKRQFSEAIYSNNKNALKTLLEQGLDPNLVLEDPWSRKVTALEYAWFALTEESLPLLRLLVKHGADPNRCKHCLLSIMACIEARHIAKFLLEAGADPTCKHKEEEGHNALMALRYEEKPTRKQLSIIKMYEQCVDR